jgi:Skp family chaperone for outer membrane proteins
MTWINQERWRDEVEIPAETLSYMRADQMKAQREKEEQAEEEKRRGDMQMRAAIDKKIAELRSETPREYQELEEKLRKEVSEKFPKLAESPTHLHKQCEVALRMHIRTTYFNK